MFPRTQKIYSAKERIERWRRRKRTRKKINENNLLANDFLLCLFFFRLQNARERFLCDCGVKKRTKWNNSSSDIEVFINSFSPKKSKKIKIKWKARPSNITCVKATRDSSLDYNSFSAQWISILDFYEPCWIWHCRGLFRESLTVCSFRRCIIG